MQSVIDIWEKDRDVTKIGSTERKFRNKMRRICEEDDCYLDKDCTFKRDLRKGDNDEELVVTSDHIKLKGKLLYVVQRVWQ